MLKLEKIGADKHIHVSLREKDAFWSPAFRKAFCIAFLFHMLAVGLFRVQPFKIKGSQLNFTPAVVNVDFEVDKDENLAIASIEYEKKMDWLQPIASTPLFPELSYSQTIQSNPSMDEQVPLQNAKTPTTIHPVFWEEWGEVSPSYKMDIQLVSKTGMIESNAKDVMEKYAQQLCRFSSCYLSYQIYIDPLTGHLVYWNLLDSHPLNQKNILVFVEKLLTQFQCFMDKNEKGILQEAILEFSLISCCSDESITEDLCD